MSNFFSYITVEAHMKNLDTFEEILDQFEPNTEINEETATNNSFIQDNQDIWLNTPLQEKQKKIAHRL